MRELVKKAMERVETLHSGSLSQWREAYREVGKCVKELFKEFGLVGSTVVEGQPRYLSTYFGDDLHIPLLAIRLPSGREFAVSALFGYDYKLKPSYYFKNITSCYYWGERDAFHYPSLPWGAPLRQLFPLMALGVAIGEEEGASPISLKPYPAEPTISYDITIPEISYSITIPGGVIRDAEVTYEVKFTYGILGGGRYNHERHLEEIVLGTATSKGYEILVTPETIKNFLEGVKLRAAVSLLSWG